MALASTFACVAAYGQFVNGDFETGTFTGWTLTNSTNGQSLVQDIQLFNTGPGISNAAHFQVGQVAFQSGFEAGIMVTQNLNLTQGTTYTFTCTWGAQNVSSGGNADGGTYDLIANGTVIASAPTGSISGGQIFTGTLSGTFTPTTTGSFAVGAYVHRHFVATSNVNSYVDNFTMSPVPEPASLLVIGAGLAAVLKRRRK